MSRSRPAAWRPPPAFRQINRDQLERYVALAEEIAASGRAAPATVDGLLALRGVLEAGDEEDDPEGQGRRRGRHDQGLAAALDALKVLAPGRGAHPTATVLSGLVDRIETLSAQAETEADAQTTAIKDRVSSAA